MMRRPKPGEDDLEKMMAEFDAQKDNPSCEIVKRKPSEEGNSESTKRVKSLFSRKREEARLEAGARQADANNGEAEMSESEKSRLEPVRDVISDAVLGGIVEKTVELGLAQPPKLDSKSAFPAVVKVKSGDDDRPSKRSLFSQQFQAMKKNLSKEKDILTTGSGLPTRSYVVTGSGLNNIQEAEALHQENLAKLHSMSQEEIIAEQEKLKNSLSPDLIEFLKRRRTQGFNFAQEAPSKAKDLNKVQVESMDTDASEPAEVESSADEVVKTLISKYPNMNRDEPEKREWMTDVPGSSDVSGKLADHGFSARFGFDGHLLDPTKDNDIRSGLYHHGEEPNRPGYTLEEIFLFIRSTNARQKVVGLETLTSVLKVYWTGVMDACFAENLIQEMIKGGLVSILRSCMDEKEESVVFAATDCMANLISAAGDEAALDYTVVWSTEQPQLQPVLPEEEKEEGSELTDYELSQLDIVAALLRMDVLARIRYILTTLRPGPGTVIASLQILIRLVRHSAEAAKQVLLCPGLMDCIVREFLPPQLPHTYSSSTLYGVPVSAAAKLCRIIAGWSRQLAQQMAENVRLMNAIAVYLTMEPSQVSIPAREAVLACLEGYRTWCHLLRFGFGWHQFLDMYPMLVRQLLYFSQKVDVDTDDADAKYNFNYDIGSWLCQLLTSMLGLLDEGAVAVKQLLDVSKLVVTCARKWLTQLTRRTALTSTSAANLVGCCLQYLSLYIVKCKKLEAKDTDVISLNQLKEELADSLLPNFFASSYYKFACDSILSNSCFLSDLTANIHRSPSTLPLADSVLSNGKVHPSLTISGNHLFMVLNVLRLASTLQHNLTGVQMEATALAPLNKYLNKISLGGLSLMNNWFSRHEARLLFWALSLRFLETKIDLKSHRAALVACSTLQTPDEFLVQQLMERIVFNTNVLDSSLLIEKYMSHMSLTSVRPLASAGHTSNQIEQSDVIKNSLDNIDDIKETYLRHTLKRVAGEQSHAVHTLVPAKVRTLSVSGETVLPQDWPYLPLLRLYNAEQEAPPSAEEAAPRKPAAFQVAHKLSLQKTSDVRNCLAWLVLADMPTANNHVARQAAAKYFRLATVFLCSSDIFLDPGVHALLDSLARRVTGADLSTTVPGLSSGHDFYLQLLDQFQAVSYGDELFSFYTVLPIAMNQPVAFRRTFWAERSTDLARMITLSPDHFTDKELRSFLEPCESELDVLTGQLRAVMSQTIIRQRNPFLFKVAVSHLTQCVNLAADGNAELAKFRAAATEALARLSQ